MLKRGGKKCVQMKWVFTREKEGVCVWRVLKRHWCKFKDKLTFFYWFKPRYDKTFLILTKILVQYWLQSTNKFKNLKFRWFPFNQI